MRTTPTLIVHSHHGNEVLDLSADCIGFETDKARESAGTATFHVKFSRDYMNLIQPGDVVTFYGARGDGAPGRTQVMFGFVNAPREGKLVAPNSAVSLTLQLHCSDFQKAVDRTNLYLSPELVGRDDLMLDPAFSGIEVGGFALKQSGIVVQGSPSEIVEGYLTGLMGFGAQFNLPDSYKVPADIIAARREAARERAYFRLNEEGKRALSGLLLPRETNAERDPDGALAALEEALIDTGELTWATVQEKLRNASALQFDLAGFRNILTKLGSKQRAVFDIASLDFIEHGAIDGFTTDISLFEQQGMVGALLRSLTNDIVNELFYDLRPVAAGDDPVFGEVYSREADLLGMNDGAVQYVPAVVMREHPFSTVEGYPSPVGVGSSLFADPLAASFAPFGPIFAQRLGQPGRAVYDYRSLGSNFGAGRNSLSPVETEIDDRGPLKHLDIVTITDAEMIGERQLGRSDAEVFNYVTCIPATTLLGNYRHVMRDILPIVSPSSISRFGLRVLELRTRFALYAAAKKGVDLDGTETRRQLARWALLADHWYQHNHEYLTGTVPVHFRPDIRVGYRLDWLNRHESYFVERVRHSWRYWQQVGITSLDLTRGQRNDPLPAYIPPMKQLPKGPTRPGAGAPVQSGGERRAGGRLDDAMPILTEPTIPPPHAPDTNTLDAPTPGGIPGDVVYPGSAPVTDFTRVVLPSEEVA